MCIAIIFAFTNIIFTHFVFNFFLLAVFHLMLLHFVVELLYFPFIFFFILL